jgi:hypothetical protein
VKRPLRDTHRVLMAYSRGIPPPVFHGTVRSEECAAVGRARLPPFSCRLERACAKRPNLFVAGARAARDGAARAEPAAAADGRCRWAARGARGGAGLAAVGAARDGLRGDREAQGASWGCLCVRGAAWAYAGSIACSYRAGYSSGIRYGPSPPRFPQYGAVASKLATKHAAGQGQCLKCLSVPECAVLSLSGGAQNCAIQ